MSDIRITFDDKGTLAKLRKTQFFLQGDSTMMAEMAAYTVTQIKSRTSAGKDYQGSVFKAYSPGYKIFKAKAGHPTNKPNLLFSGRMLAAMSGKAISKKESRVLFASQEETNKANKNQKTRQFFGFNKSDKIGMEKIYNKYLEKAIR